MIPQTLRHFVLFEKANVVSVHRRQLRCDRDCAGQLLDGFDAPTSPLWPYQQWPRDRFDGPMRVGTVGGHGATRYRLERYQPGREALFRFIAPQGYEGIHGFQIHGLDNGKVCLVHFTCLRLSPYHRLMWHLMVRWVHDALLGDLFDSAEQHLCGSVRRRRRWKWRVHLIRHALGGARLLAETAGLKRSSSHARQ